MCKKKKYKILIVKCYKSKVPVRVRHIVCFIVAAAAADGFYSEPDRQHARCKGLVMTGTKYSAYTLL